MDLVAGYHIQVLVIMSIVETRSQAAAAASASKDEMKDAQSQASTADDAYNYDIEQINAQRRERPWENKYEDRFIITATRRMG